MDKCIIWQKYIDKNGYGRRFIKGRVWLSHRWAYTQKYGEIPKEKTIDHLCRNRACVNPNHLEAVSLKENIARGSRKNQTHCKHGHEFNKKNTYYWKGRRVCRVCNRNIKIKSRLLE